MLRALLFDMGGTLDGDGRHWLDRFADLYTEAGVSADRVEVRAAFDEAERRAAADVDIASANLDAMIDRHVRWQLDVLRSSRQFDEWRLAVGTAAVEQLPARITSAFVEDVRRASARNVPVLRGLAERGYVLGVVSNGCGNVRLLCDELGYGPLLSVVVDSRLVGVQKPDCALFLHAAGCLALPPASIMMIGDSIERDVQPARSVGMMTAWLQGPDRRACPDTSCVDITLRSLTELPAALDAFLESVA